MSLYDLTKTITECQTPMLRLGYLPNQGVPMSTTIIIPVLCDEHEVTSIPREIAPDEWAIVGLHCWDCDQTFWCEEE